MDGSNLKEKEELIRLISESYNEQDILSMSRNLGINSADFYSRESTLKKNTNDFVERVYQLGKEKELKDCLLNDCRGMISQIKTNDKAAEKFSMLLNSFLDKLSDIDYKTGNFVKI